MIRGAYLPLAGGGGGDARRDFAEAIAAGRLTMDDLMARYCTLLYAETGNYQEAGRRLGVDPRTVKAKLDEDWLTALRRR